MLRAAVEEFASRGFHATTTRGIAERVGLSPAALYVHFPSKHHVLFEIVRACHESALADVRAATESTSGAADQIAAAIGAFASWHARYPMAARVAQSELRSLDDSAFRVIADLRDRLEGIVGRIVEDGQAAGEFDRELEPRTATRALLSLGIDVSRWFRAEGPLSPADVGRLYAEFAKRILRADRT